ncbi:hypothetical protein J7643_16455 [bacterium]|nr:hypothetical protein [bacterium]
MKHAMALGLTLVVALATGCTNRVVAVQAAKIRTYSTDIKPITSDQRCYQCHVQQKGQVFADGMSLGTYAYDSSSKRISIKAMVQSNASAKANPAEGFLTEAQTQTVLDWIAAGTPNDDKPF